MGKFRQRMREGRRTLHEHMSVPALYFADPSVDDPILITVRVHEKWVALGDLKGTNFNYAEVSDIAPRIIFLRSEIEPERGYLVSVEPGVAFRIDNVLPPDDITVTATVIALSPDDTVGLPVPPPEV